MARRQGQKKKKQPKTRYLLDPSVMRAHHRAPSENASSFSRTAGDMPPEVGLGPVTPAEDFFAGALRRTGMPTPPPPFKPSLVLP